VKGKYLPTRPLAAAVFFHPTVQHHQLLWFSTKSHVALPKQKCCTHRGHSLRASRFHKPVFTISCRPESLARKGASPPTPTTIHRPHHPHPQPSRRPHQLLHARGRLQREIPAQTNWTTQNHNRNVVLATSEPKSTLKTRPLHLQPRPRKLKAKQSCLHLGLCQPLQRQSMR
jgi:hypothetical protein